MITALAIITTSLVMGQKENGNNSADRELLFCNSRNTISVYKYNSDSTLKYVFYFKDVEQLDLLSYEYLNFENVKDLNQFIELAVYSMTDRKYLHFTLYGEDRYLYGTSKNTAVIYADKSRGLLNKSDAEKIKSVIKKY